MPKCGFLFNVQGLCYCPDCEGQVRSCVCSSDVDGKQLYEKILGCKMLVAIVQFKSIAS